MLSFKKYYPVQSLRPFVQFYYKVEYLESPGEEEKDTLPNHPQGTVDLMFLLGGAMILNNEATTDQKLTKICVIAQQEGRFNIQFSPSTIFYGIVFYGEVFSKMFDFPLDELTNQGIILENEIDPEYHQLHEQLMAGKSDLECVQLIDDFIHREFASLRMEAGKFDQFIAYIRQSQGLLSVEQMKDMANMSKRTLQRKMKATVGVSPKTYSQILRFNHALKMLTTQPELDWHDVLHNSGYYDQAHFIKDFKRFTGRTPSEYMKGNTGLSDHFLSE